jgi:hypothetical protein
MKTNYEALALQLETLYTVKINENDNNAIHEHCNFIAMFIEDNGWDVEEYMEEYLRRGMLEYTGDINFNMN